MSEGYEGHGGTAWRQSGGLYTAKKAFGPAAVFTPTTAKPCSDDAQNPFLGHTFRVSGLRDELRAWRAAPDGRIRHA